MQVKSKKNLSLEVAKKLDEVGKDLLLLALEGKYESGMYDIEFVKDITEEMTLLGYSYTLLNEKVNFYWFTPKELRDMRYLECSPVLEILSAELLYKITNNFIKTRRNKLDIINSFDLELARSNGCFSFSYNDYVYAIKDIYKNLIVKRCLGDQDDKVLVYSDIRVIEDW